MTEAFVGKYKLTSSENFDEYMKAIGVGFATRVIGNQVKPVVGFTINGDEWDMTSASTFKNTSLKFKLNEEFDEVTPDGRKVKTKMILETPTKLVQIQTDPGSADKNTTVTREIVGDELKTTCVCGAVVSKRNYHRV